MFVYVCDVLVANLAGATIRRFLDTLHKNVWYITTNNVDEVRHSNSVKEFP
jgi:hypothetical protein